MWPFSIPKYVGDKATKVFHSFENPCQSIRKYSRKKFKNSKRAQKAGYKPCPECVEHVKPVSKLMFSKDELLKGLPFVSSVNTVTMTKLETILSESTEADLIDDDKIEDN